MNFSEIIYEWYEKNKRDLPWRHTRDPYLVWISEVILQQTRVLQGLDYYKRFADSYPNLEALASASEEQVLKLWQGLGYYSRARNMHQAARDLVEKNGGKMPETYKELLAMKGVGTYTASAIASICFGKDLAVVDGNVARVISRIHGVKEPVNGTAGKHIIDSLAEQFLTEGMANHEFDPGIHNQAMMEFGALQCVPSSPNCETCPLSEGCMAFLSKCVSKLPVKNPKRKARERWMYFYVVRYKDQTILSRRNERGIWRSLYHFPALEFQEEQSDADLCNKLIDQVLSQLTMDVNEAFPPGVNETSPSGVDGDFRSGETVISGISGTIRHQLTHLTIHARFIHIGLSSLPSSLPENYIRIPVDELEHYPVPRLIERYMESAKI